MLKTLAKLRINSPKAINGPATNIGAGILKNPNGRRTLSFGLMINREPMSPYTNPEMPTALESGKKSKNERLAVITLAMNKIIMDLALVSDSNAVPKKNRVVKL